ncbi:MAG: ClbS/DfsB family four-helix bundle protein [Anaerolineales bacterium]
MTDDTLPKSKAELMSLIEREWSALMDVVEQLSPEQMLTPDEGGWSPKDNLAHLTVWMDILLGFHMDQRSAHEVAGIPSEMAVNWDIDEGNAIFFERYRDRPVEQVLDELKQTYDKVHARLESMSYEGLMKPRRADDPEKRPILNWILGDTSEHFEEHRETIAKMLKA